MKTKLMTLMALLSLMTTGSIAMATGNTPDSNQPLQIGIQAVSAPTTVVAPITETSTQAISTIATVVPPAPLTAKDFLLITQTSTPVRNNALSGKYEAVLITLKNEKAYHLQILNAEVLNGVDEAFVANEALQKSNHRRRAAGGLLRGLSSVPFVGGLGGYGSLGAYRAAALGSSLANTSANVMEGAAQQQAANIEGRYVRTISSAIISPNDTYNFTALVPKSQAPQMKIIFKNMETNQIYDIQQ